MRGGVPDTSCRLCCEKAIHRLKASARPSWAVCLPIRSNSAWTVRCGAVRLDDVLMRFSSSDHAVTHPIRSLLFLRSVSCDFSGDLPQLVRRFIVEIPACSFSFSGFSGDLFGDSGVCFLLIHRSGFGFVLRIQVKMLFSPGRFKKFVGEFVDDQKGFVEESGFGHLLHISDFKVPVPLLEWVMSIIIVGVSEFRFEGRSIRFIPSMVSKVLGIPSGNDTIEFASEVDEEVSSVYDDYLNGKDKPAISCAIGICLAEHN
ncbi:uncharacterized protein LOC112883197 [Panicum hallii]|nr:uncharacterized protein LOC112883197 [Panicum hallii]